MLGYPIEPIIRDTLEEKRKILGRTIPDPYSPRGNITKRAHQQNIVKTPYIFMISAPVFESDVQNTIILGNQEYSTTTSVHFNYGKYLYSDENPNFTIPNTHKTAHQLTKSTRSKRAFRPVLVLNHYHQNFYQVIVFNLLDI